MFRMQREITPRNASGNMTAGQECGMAGSQGGGHRMILTLDSSVRVYHSPGQAGQEPEHHGRTSGK